MTDAPAPSAESSARRRSEPQRVLRVVKITLALNLLNALLKLGAGLWSRNLTVVSDAVHAFMDAANNVVGWAALKASWRPPDANHPYGHRKYEALAALAVGGLMTLTSWELFKAVVQRWRGMAAVQDRLDPLWLAMVGLGLAINLFVAAYEARRGRQLGSQFLVADAAHTRVDVAVTSLAVASLTLTPRWPWLDWALTLPVIGVILWTGWTVIRDNALLLTDAARMDPEPIRRIVESVPNVRNCHAIRTHGMPDEVHLDLHIVIAPDLSAYEANVIEMQVRQALIKAFPQIREVAIHHQTHAPQTAKPLSMQP